MLSDSLVDGFAVRVSFQFHIVLLGNCLILLKQRQPYVNCILLENGISLSNKSFYCLACVAGAKREVGPEREKGVKGKREGSACYKSQCFCIPPTNFR